MGVVYFQSFPSVELVSPQQVFSISLCGVFYFPLHRHHIEGTNSFHCLFQKTQAKWGKRSCPSFETAEVVLNPGRPKSPTLDHRAPPWPTRDETIVAELTPPGYTFQHVARTSGRGGGVAIVHRNTFNTKILPKLPFTTIELLRLYNSLTRTC